MLYKKDTRDAKSLQWNTKNYTKDLIYRQKKQISLNEHTKRIIYKYNTIEQKLLMSKRQFGYLLTY